MNYGRQRVWGAIGFGLTALLGGLGMDLWSGGDVKNYTPAFILVLAFTLIDMFCCLKLKVKKRKLLNLPNSSEFSKNSINF